MTILGIVLFFACGIPAQAAGLHFPALTGRVVDDAHILSAQTVETLDQKLADYENGTTNQVVVVTLNSLQGDSIEDYGYQLGRTWAIGQKKKDNGVLLIVAPHEHKVRIEVGYGLEPLLTDAVSSQIVNGVILPAFKAGDMERGVADGTDAILSVLGGSSVTMPQHQQSYKDSPVFGFLVLALIMVPFMISFTRNPLGTLFLLSAFRSGGGSWGGGSGYGGGGGFSGGGGSFGGGGSSGSW